MLGVLQLTILGLAVHPAEEKLGLPLQCTRPHFRADHDGEGGRDTCLSAAVLPKTDAVSCGAAAVRRRRRSSAIDMLNRGTAAVLGVRNQRDDQPCLLYLQVISLVPLNRGTAAVFRGAPPAFTPNIAEQAGCFFSTCCCSVCSCCCCSSSSSCSGCCCFCFCFCCCCCSSSSAGRGGRGRGAAGRGPPNGRARLRPGLCARHGGGVGDAGGAWQR